MSKTETDLEQWKQGAQNMIALLAEYSRIDGDATEKELFYGCRDGAAKLREALAHVERLEKGAVKWHRIPDSWPEGAGLYLVSLRGSAGNTWVTTIEYTPGRGWRDVIKNPHIQIDGWLELPAPFGGE